jgi:hypothetical protein
MYNIHIYIIYNIYYLYIVCVYYIYNYIYCIYVFVCVRFYVLYALIVWQYVWDLPDFWTRPQVTISVRDGTGVASRTWGMYPMIWRSLDITTKPNLLVFLKVLGPNCKFI